MADPKVNIIISAEDKASKVLGNIGGALKGALAVGVAGATAALAGLAVGMGVCVKEAMAAEEQQAKLNAVIKATGGIAGVTAEMANQLATEFSNMTTFEDDAIVAGESMLLTFKNIGKDVFPQATEAMLNMSAMMGTDLQGSAIQLGKALNDPIAGISALSRVGVTFTEEQKKMIEGFMATGDIASAQGIILKELESEFGGVAVAAGQTLSGQLQILKNNFGNIAESVGTAVLPMLSNLLAGVMTFVQSEQFTTWVQTVTTWLTTNLPIALAWVSNVWQTVLLPAITTVWTWMSTVLIPFLQNTVVPWLQIYIPIALQVLSDFWTNVLQPAIQTVWAWISGTLIPFLQNTVVPWLQVMIPAALQVLSNFWTNVLQPAIQAVWAWISGTLIPFFQNTVIPILQVLIPAALKILSDMWQNVLLPIITGVWNFLTVQMMPIWKAIGDLLGVVIPLVLTALAGFWQNVLLPAVQAVVNFIQTYVVPIFTKLGQGIGGVSSAIQTVVGWIQKMIDKLSNIELPDWLTPGSPTPFEMGLRGIADAMREIDGVTTNVGFIPRGAGNQAVNNRNSTFNMTIHTNAPVSNILGQYNMMKAQAG